MIYMVDEDVGQIEPWLVELRMRGHRVELFRDAGRAFEALSRCEQADLIIIDVMLADSDQATRRYSQEETEDYLITGLKLLDDLVQTNKNLFPARAAILSQTSKRKVVERIERTCELHQIPFWRKNNFTDVTDFGDAVDQQILKIRGAGGG